MTSPSSTRSVTLRAVLIALIFTVPNSYWLMISWGTGGYDSGQSFPTVVSLYFNAVFILLLLIGWNYLTRFFAPRKQFSDGELIVVYLLLAVASSIAGHDMLQLLWPLIPHSIWFATPENEWAELFHHHIPDWLTVKERDALIPLYQGESTLHTWSHLRLWIKPVFWWSSLIVVLTWMMLCLTVLVQRQWVYREKLTYPIVQIPIQLTERNGYALFSNRLFWIGFILAGSMNLINGLHFLFPVVPSVGGIGHNPSKVGFDLGQLFTEKPFNAIGYTPLAVYPFVVGLSFFIPLNLSFSIWFFYLFRKIVLVWGTMLGLKHLPGFPFAHEQLFGAWFALGLIAVWVSRKFLIEQIKSAFWRRDEDIEHVRIVRQAAIGLISGVFFVLFFCFSFGVSAIHTVAYFGLFFALAIAITRVRAELGPPTHDVLWHPGGALISFLGTRRFGGKSLTLFTLFRGFNRSYRCHPMPVMLEGFQSGRIAQHCSGQVNSCNHASSSGRYNLIGLGILCSGVPLWRCSLRRALDSGCISGSVTHLVDYASGCGAARDCGINWSVRVYRTAHRPAPLVYLVALAPCRLCNRNRLPNHELVLGVNPIELVNEADFIPDWRNSRLSERGAVFYWVGTW